MKATTVRLDEATVQAVQAEAKTQGTNPSDFIRSAIVFRLGWLAALRDAGTEGNPTEPGNAE